MKYPDFAAFYSKICQYDRHMGLKLTVHAPGKITYSLQVDERHILDIARHLDEPMGNRGIRRCVGSGGATIRLLCEAIREVLEERGGHIGLILPLVSHYSQIRATMEQVLSTGLPGKPASSGRPVQPRAKFKSDRLPAK